MLRWSALLLLAACTGTATTTPEAGPDPAASAVTAQKLCYVFQHVRDSCRASGDLVELDGRTLKVEATFKHQVDLPGGAARNIAYAVSLNGESAAYAVEVMAKGTDPDDAVDRAAQAWAALVGTAIADGIRDTGTSDAVAATLIAGKRMKEGPAPAALPLGTFRVYPGIFDIRGAMQDGPHVDHAGLLEALSGPLSAAAAGKPHSVLVSMKHDGARMTCERGELDGRALIDVCAAAESFGWPAAATPYSVRQFYLMVPGPTPAGAVPPPAAETDAPQ